MSDFRLIGLILAIALCSFSLGMEYAKEPENKLEVVALNTGVCSNCKAMTQVIIREKKGAK